MGLSLNKIFNSKNKQFLLFCFSFVFGVIVASIFDYPRLYLYVLIMGLAVISGQLLFFWKNKPARLILLIIMFILVGLVRYSLAKPYVDENHISFFNNQIIEFIGQIAIEPDVRIGYTNYILEPINKKGKVQIKTKLYPRYSYGDYLEIKCKLQQPKNFSERFNYEKYLERFGVNSLCYYPTVNTANDSPDSTKIILFKKILKLKIIVANRIDQLWPEPQSSFMAGLLYGSRSGLPPELTENFNRTGITHIIAISGYNITIIVMVMMLVLINLGLYRQQAFWVCLTGIVLFVIFTGSSASVVRAGIMGMLVLFGQYLGRLSQIGTTMLLALVIMLLINPFVLFWDAGFQLSFIATLGLVYISPRLENLFKTKIKNNFLNVLSITIATTLAAIVATLPLILYQFGRLSIVAPLANLLILWAVPILMLLGFLAVVISFIFYPLGLIIAWTAGLGLKYIITTVNVLGQLEYSSVEFSIPFWLTAVSYLIMIYYFYLKKEYD